MTQLTNQSPGEQNKYDEPLKLPSDLDRLSLPGDQVGVFEEVQSFDQVWLWVLLGVQTTAMLLALILTSQAFLVIMLTSFIMVMSMSVMAWMKLRLRIDDAGVHYRFTPFHFKEKTIPMEEIDSIFVREYSPIMDYGGWGIRVGRSGTAYTVKGKYGIQVVKKNGKRILIGIQQPEEAAQFLEGQPLSV